MEIFRGAPTVHGVVLRKFNSDVRRQAVREPSSAAPRAASTLEGGEQPGSLRDNADQRKSDISDLRQCENSKSGSPDFCKHLSAQSRVCPIRANAKTSGRMAPIF